MANKHHLEQVADIIAAIDKLHADTSVEVETTIDSLSGIKEHIDVLIEACESSVDDD